MFEVRVVDFYFFELLINFFGGGLYVCPVVGEERCVGVFQFLFNAEVIGVVGLGVGVIEFSFLVLFLVVPPGFFVVSFDFGHLFSKIRKRIHLSPLEILIFEVHMVFLLGEFVYLPEFVHIQLPHERRQVPMPEEVRQHLLFKFFPTFNENLVVAIPTEIIIKLGLLH